MEVRSSPTVDLLACVWSPDAPVEAGARWRLSVTDNSQGWCGDASNMLRLGREHNEPVTQTELCLVWKRPLTQAALLLGLKKTCAGHFCPQ
jgi:hypothetical protein